jgi:hypothetical protein
MSAVPAQGSQLYFEDPDTGVISEVDCITELTGLSQTRDQIETTCLSDNERSYIAGLATPGTASFSIYPDPTSASHLRLHELATAGTTIHWALGWSDGKGIAPTDYDSNGWDLPATRTWLTFDGYISDFPFDFAQNSVVTSGLGIQTSGPTEWIPKA